MSIYQEIIHAIENPGELVSGSDYRRMMRDVLSLPRDFTGANADDLAEDWVLLNPLSVGRVIERGVHVQSYIGKKRQA